MAAIVASPQTCSGRNIVGTVGTVVKFLLVAAVLSIPFAMASPTEPGGWRDLFARDKPKLSIYNWNDEIPAPRNFALPEIFA